eukprot:COSAG06_NODE_112_length_23474_cov_81.804458_21_plen_73_part_00
MSEVGIRADRQHRPRAVRKTVFFCEVSLRLSRAYLSKMIVFSTNWRAKKPAFFPHVDRLSVTCCSPAPSKRM